MTRRTEENYENLNQDSRYAGLDSSQGPPEHKLEELPTQPACSESEGIKELFRLDLKNCIYSRFI
jgi:hypothetical protein